MRMVKGPSPPRLSSSEGYGKQHWPAKRFLKSNSSKKIQRKQLCRHQRLHESVPMSIRNNPRRLGNIQLRIFPPMSHFILGNRLYETLARGRGRKAIKGSIVAQEVLAGHKCLSYYWMCLLPSSRQMTRLRVWFKKQREATLSRSYLSQTISIIISMIRQHPIVDY